MPTIEERLAALESKMAQLTDTTPTTYYTHQYSGEEIDAAVGRAMTGGALDTSVGNVSKELGTFVRPNLLDNWYFGRPVNQRGQTSWVNPSGWQYAIDRWQITPSSVIALVDGGITITADFHQGLEKDRLEFGRTYTLSVLSSDGRLGKHTFVLTSDPNINVNFGFGYFVCYLSGGNVWFRIYGDGSTYKAAKLELGTQQTLAHQDTDGNWVLNEIPDYGEQLRRCQRYYLQFNAYTKFIAQYIDGNKVVFVLPVSMRTAPGMSGGWKIYTGFTEQTGFTLNTYQTGNIIVIEAVKANHGLTSAWLGVDGIGALNADL